MRAKEILSKFKRRKKPFVFFLQAVGVVVLLFFSFYHLAYANKTLPGLYMGGTDFSALAEPEVNKKLDSVERVASSTWVLVIGETPYEISAEQLGLTFEKNATKARLFSAGRQKNLVTSFSDKFYALTVGLEVEPIYAIDKDKLKSFVDKIVLDSSKDFKNARYLLDEEGSVVIEPHENGFMVNKDLVIAAINNYYFKFNGVSGKLDLVVIEPEIKNSDLEKEISTIQSFISKDITITYKNSTFIPTSQEKLSLIRFDVDKNKLVVVADSDYFKSVVGEINKPVKAEVFKVEEGKVVNFVPAEDGVRVIETQFIDSINHTLSVEDEYLVEVPVEITKTERGVNEYGIRELIGSGDTTYYHSAANRVYNVNLAASKVTGVLVPPDTEFSFNEVVGEVSSATGYKPAYIIYNNKTILGDGGGLCQVSTTLFRAILDAGLPVTSRIGHAYRVGYYEQNSGPGFDATVFVPSVDLKFYNDTGNYLLIVAESKPEEYYLHYSIYGTSDGREVELTEPVIKAQIPPPDPIYQDDSSLPKGTVKQVEWAAWGAVVEYVRVIKRDGKVVSEDVFKTNYKPWAAAYLVGTG